ncbi:flavin reductase family protein [Paenarthrobacter sp. NPDC057981]|uniref:flavin reductase family protein n=1 Tax=Paenarthrobacter sp. NPDC057981 TaxID=3346297 RepID=UPI0036DCE5D8
MNLVKEGMTNILSSKELRGVYGTFPTGVVAVAAIVDGVRVGLAASSFTSVSLEPPLVSVAFDSASTTWPLLQASGRIGISVLANGQGDLCRQLAARNVDRFDGAATTVSDTGGVFFDGAVSWLEVQLHAELVAGDHTVALFEVRSVRTFVGREPLVFHRSSFHSLASVGTA